MRNKHRTYIGERHLELAIVVVSDADEIANRVEVVGRLSPRRDLAPRLPDTFDWGPRAPRLAVERLALSMLADALREEADGDELALALAERFAREDVSQFLDRGFKMGAWAIARWAVEQREITCSPALDSPALIGRAG